MNNKKTVMALGLLTGLIAVALLFPEVSHAAAAGAGGGTLPWDGPMQTIMNSFTGNIAKAIASIGVVVCGAVLVMGQHLDEFFKKAIALTLGVSLCIGAISFIATVGTNGVAL